MRRAKRSQVVVVSCVVLACAGLAGCDTGGLLVVDEKPTEVPQAPPAGPPVVEMVGAGNVASNDQYKVQYVVGQPSPNQNVATSSEHQARGGLVGAAHTD